MTNENVASVVRDFDAMAAECGGLEAATIHAMTARLSVAHAREVGRAVANERARDVHTCHDQCERPLCALTRRAEAAEAEIAQAERRRQECCVEARIHFEDPRYPTLVLDGDAFGTIGYELRRDTGELRRVCICHAYCEHECVCGYDAAIASGGEDRKA